MSLNILAPVSDPQASVVICAYNAAATIAETLGSVQAQTLRSIEILVIDDGSTDNTAEICRAIALNDPRVRLIAQANAGVGCSRNRGVEAARAPIIAFIDADDRWQTTHLAGHVARLAADTMLGVSFSQARFISLTGEPTGEFSRTPEGRVSPQDVLSGNPCTTCSTMVIRRAVFARVGGFRADMRYAEDQEWLLRVALSPFGLFCDGQRSVDYRTSPDGLSANLDAMLTGFDLVQETACRLSPELSRRYAAPARARMLCYAARRSVRINKSLKPALTYLMRAVWASPLTLLCEPRRVIGVLVRLLLPRTPSKLSLHL